MPSENPTIIFDVLTKSVMILRDEGVVTLPGPFGSQAEAVRAAKEECVKRGWMAQRG